MRLRLVLVPLLAAFALACAGTAWRAALDEDTPAAYHRFLRDHPDASQAEAARERLDFVLVRRKPSAEGYRAFVAAHPDSELLAELRPLVEEQVFSQVRAAGTADAYREFLREFADGPNAARAAGNLAFIEAGGFAGRPSELAAFAREHPDSDFAAEARRSAAALDSSGDGFRRVGLRIEIAPGTPGAGRLARAFAERAVRQYEARGLALVPVSASANPEKELPVQLLIRHEEKRVKTELGSEQVRGPGILATTDVSLSRIGDSRPIWSQRFEHRANLSEHREDSSVLFGAGTELYWTSFFVPVATWDTRVAVRPPQSFDKPVVAVEAGASRAYVLSADGHFEIFDIGDPEAPLPIAEYRRSRDLARFGGLKLAGGRMAIYGEDGLEIVDLTAEGGPSRRLALPRGTVGSIVGMAPLGEDWIAASNRGLLRVDAEGGVETLIGREILGVGSSGERIFFTDGTSLFVSSVPLLRFSRVESELRLGSGFGPGRIRVQGASVLVLGRVGVVWADASIPGQARVVSRIDAAEAGQIRDVALAGGHLFLLGERGLLFADRAGEHVVETADVAARQRLAATGRHLVMVGDQSLQVVDATPFVARGAASPGP